MDTDTHVSYHLPSKSFSNFLRKKDRHLHDVCLCGIFHPLFLILLFYDLFQLFSNFLIRYLDAKLLKPAVMQMHLHDVCLCGIFHPLFLILLFYDLFQLFSNFLIRYLDAKLLKPAVMQMLICFC